MPRVSVIIPAFNAAPYLAETLQSVVDQTYDDWEVVLADDCSTDATLAIAESFGERVTVLPGTENAGPAAARNRAIARSSGQLLAFLDSDDYWLPEYLERQVGLFDEGQAREGRVGIVACNARMLTASGFLPMTFMDAFGDPAGMTVIQLLKANTIFGLTLSSKEIVVEAGGYCEDIFGAEDHDLWLRILELGYRVVSNPEPLLVYRMRPGSVSANQASMAWAVQKVYRRALERGNLSPRERRIAARELRVQRAIERIASSDGISSGSVLRTLPLLALVAVEHPKRWPSYARTLVGRKRPRALF
jgi:teichuronic acid biosynthesis glycosyltransferase TuaG